MLAAYFKHLLNLNLRKNNFLSGLSIVFFVKILGAFFVLILHILLSRFLGSEKVGIYFLSLTVVNIAIIASAFGLGNAIVKFSAQSYVKNDWQSLFGLQRNAISIVISTSTFLTLLTVIFSPWIAIHIFHKPALIDPLRWMALCVLPVNLVGIYSSIFKGVQKFSISTIIENLIVPILIIILLLFFKNEISVSLVCIFYSSATILNSIFAFFLWKQFSNKQKDNREHFKYKTLLNTSLPMYVVALMNMLMGMSDTIMLGIFKDSHTVGVYNVALRISTLSSMILVVVNTVIAPRFSILFFKNEKLALERIARNTTIFMTIIAAILLITFISIPGFILTIFGKDFIDGKIVFIILSFGQFVVLSTGPVAALLMMTGNEKYHRNTVVISAFVNILSNFILIPIYAGVGAAIATSFSLILKNILAVFYVERKLGILLFYPIFSKNF